MNYPEGVLLDLLVDGEGEEKTGQIRIVSISPLFRSQVELLLPAYDLFKNGIVTPTQVGEFRDKVTATGLSYEGMAPTLLPCENCRRHCSVKTFAGTTCEAGSFAQLRSILSVLADNHLITSDEASKLEAEAREKLNMPEAMGPVVVFNLATIMSEAGIRHRDEVEEGGEEGDEYDFLEGLED